MKASKTINVKNAIRKAYDNWDPFEHSERVTRWLWAAIGGLIGTAVIIEITRRLCRM